MLLLDGAMCNVWLSHTYDSIQRNKEEEEENENERRPMRDNARIEHHRHTIPAQHEGDTKSR